MKPKINHRLHREIIIYKKPPPTFVISSGARNLNFLHWQRFLPEPVPRARFLPSVEMTMNERVERQRTRESK